MRTADLTAGALFFVFGLYVFAASRRLPAGVGNLPGPALLPAVIGLATMALALVLAARALRSSKRGALVLDNRAALAGAFALTFAYIALWGYGTFPLRTAAYLVLLLRLLGERWTRAAAFAAVMTAVVTLGFHFGLRLTLE